MEADDNVAICVYRLPFNTQKQARRKSKFKAAGTGKCWKMSNGEKYVYDWHTTKYFKGIYNVLPNIWMQKHIRAI